MTITVELSPETEARLAAEARSRDMAPEKYAEALLRDVLAPSASGSGVLTPEGLRHMLNEIAYGSVGLPKLPTSAFSRESFYEDRL